MNAKKLSDDMLAKVAGGFDVAMLRPDEAAEFNAIRDRLEEIKDTKQGTQSEIDSLLNSLYDFERRMEKKYGK